MKYIRNFFKKINLKLRRIYFKRHYKIEKIPTIISSNCLGGFIYHDANIKFCSPTINLTFDPLDFLTFCDHLGNFENLKIEETHLKNNYPTGNIVFSDGKKANAYFVHYKTFEEASKCFIRRTLRMGNNIILLLTVEILTDEIVERFKDYPFNKKYYFLKNLANRKIDNNIFAKINNKSKTKDLLNFNAPFSRKLVIDNNSIDYYEICGFKKKLGFRQYNSMKNLN